MFCSAIPFFCLARIPIFPFLQSQYFSRTALLSLCITDNVEAELLHTFTKVYKFDTMLLLVRLAVLTAVTLTVPIVLFPVSTTCINTQSVSVLSSGSRKSCLYGKISCLELISNLFHHSPSSFGASFRQQFNLIYVRAHEHKHHACKCWTLLPLSQSAYRLCFVFTAVIQNVLGFFFVIFWTQLLFPGVGKKEHTVQFGAPSCAVTSKLKCTDEGSLKKQNFFITLTQTGIHTVRFQQWGPTLFYTRLCCSFSQHEVKSLHVCDFQSPQLHKPHSFTRTLPLLLACPYMVKD